MNSSQEIIPPTHLFTAIVEQARLNEVGYPIIDELVEGHVYKYVSDDWPKLIMKVCKTIISMVFSPTHQLSYISFEGSLNETVDVPPGNHIGETAKAKLKKYEDWINLAYQLIFRD